MKGQVAFESLLLLLIVLSATSIITTTYLGLHEENLALSYARTKTLEEISKNNESVFIEKIWIEKMGELIIKIELSGESEINANEIENFVRTKTKLKDVRVEFVN